MPAKAAPKRGAPINPKTGERWTVATLLDAIAEANEIANDAAEVHGLCSTWEDIMDDIVGATGLPFEGRGRTYYVTVHELEITVLTKAWSETEFRGHLEDALNGVESFGEITVGAVRYEQ